MIFCDKNNTYLVAKNFLVKIKENVCIDDLKQNLYLYLLSVG